MFETTMQDIAQRPLKAVPMATSTQVKVPVGLDAFRTSSKFLRMEAELANISRSLARAISN